MAYHITASHKYVPYVLASFVCPRADVYAPRARLLAGQKE